MLEIRQIQSYYEKAKTELEYFRPIQADIYDYVIPSRSNWRNNSIVMGERTDLYIYNNHPQIAAKEFADNMVSLTIPSGTRFFDLTTNDKLSNSDTFHQDIELISERILEKLNSSNFYQAVSESFLDLTAGTGGFSINYDKIRDTLFFTSLDMSKVSFLEDNTGNISYIFRNLGVLDKASQQLLMPDIKFDYDNIELLEVIYPFENSYIYMITDTMFSKVYKKVTSKTNPYIIFRWSKRSGENRGRGILHNLIGLIKMTNTMARDVLDASSLVINPPVVASRNSNLNPNNIRIEPNSIITLDNIDGIKPFPISPNLPFGYQAIASNNQEIDNAFMRNILGQVTTKEMTATEINARMQLANNVLGAAYNRLQNEMLNPLFARVIELLTLNGIIDPLVYGNKKIKLIYSSPIINLDKSIKLQKLMQSIQSTVQATGDLSFVVSAYKLNEFPLYSAKALGADISMLNTQDEVNQTLKSILQAKQQKSMAVSGVNPALNQPINLGGVPNVQ
ncbi:MAG: hypothetical protein IPP65_13250 [Chlorobi bacterium]|nr:hypothetical protein [Chlorobiota bacterium]